MSKSIHELRGKDSGFSDGIEIGKNNMDRYAAICMLKGHIQKELIKEVLGLDDETVDELEPYKKNMNSIILRVSDRSRESTWKNDSRERYLAGFKEGYDQSICERDIEDEEFIKECQGYRKDYIDGFRIGFNKAWEDRKVEVVKSLLKLDMTVTEIGTMMRFEFDEIEEIKGNLE